MAGAAPQQDPPLPTQPPTPGELPPVTISSTTLHDGDTITISGTGCMDPDTGTSEGLEVVLLRPGDGGRGGTIYIPTVRADAQADGTFEGSGVVEQPLFPTGRQTGFLSCQEKSEAGYPPVVRSRPVELDIVAPTLPDLTVAAGTTFDYELPCSVLGGEYGQFNIHFTDEALADFYLGVSGTYPPEMSPQEGDTVALDVPADASPGTYDATASCEVNEAGTSAYWEGFTVTITADDGGGTPSPAPAPAPTPTPTPAPEPAPPVPPAIGPTAPPPAEPVAGSPSFTG